MEKEHEKINALYVTINEYDIKKKEIDHVINNKCNHLEYYDTSYDDGHRWGVDHYCNICDKKIRKQYDKKDESDIEKKINEIIWNEIKKLNEERNTLTTSIKK